MSDRLKKIGIGLLVPLVIIGVLVLIAVLLHGMVWASEKALPWLTTISEIALAICVVVFLPMCIFRKTRPWAGLGFYFSSFLFGLSLWAFSCIVVVAIWGYGALAVGLVFAGIGVVPVALLATLFHAEWAWFVNVIIGIVLTFGARGLGIWLTSSAGTAEQQWVEDENEAYSAASGEGFSEKH